MENPVVSKIIELLEERCKDAFSGLTGKIKLCCIKRKLKKGISNEILLMYGNKTFYNDWDHFLVEHDVICNTVRIIMRSALSYKDISRRFIEL